MTDEMRAAADRAIAAQLAVDEAVERHRQDFVAGLRELAGACEQTASVPYVNADEALASSLNFAALRLRVVADRSDRERGARE